MIDLEQEDRDLDLALCPQSRVDIVCFLAEAGLTLEEVEAYLTFCYGKAAS
jgi:predicted transcriptional regulator